MEVQHRHGGALPSLRAHKGTTLSSPWPSVLHRARSGHAPPAQGQASWVLCPRRHVSKQPASGAAPPAPSCAVVHKAPSYGHLRKCSAASTRTASTDAHSAAACPRQRLRPSLPCCSPPDSWGLLWGRGSGSAHRHTLSLQPLRATDGSGSGGGSISSNSPSATPSQPSSSASAGQQPVLPGEGPGQGQGQRSPAEPRPSSGAGTEARTGAGAAARGGSGSGPGPGARRGRPTLLDMQEEARAKLAEAARLQLLQEQEQRAREQQEERQRERQKAAATRQAVEDGVVGAGAAGAAASVAAAAAAAAPAAAGIGAEAGVAGESRTAAGVSADGDGNEEDASRDRSEDQGSLWESLKADWADDWAAIKERWRQFMEEPLRPPPSRSPAGAVGKDQAAGRARDGLELVMPTVVEAAGATPSAAAEGQEKASGTESDGKEGEEGAKEQEEQELVRRTGTTRLLQLALAGVFVMQWAPVLQGVAHGSVAVPGRDLALALALACPPTEVTMAWQADAVTLVAGQLGCLFSSTMLHSGLLSLGASLASLEETAPWMDTLHGPLILAITYVMAGAGAVLAPMLASSAATSIGGIGAALGMEAAVAVRCWRATRELMPPTPACLACCAAAAVSAVYQPLVGPWGVVGGLLGGALSGILAYDVLYIMRVILAITILSGLLVWNVVTWLPKLAYRVLLFAGMFVWATIEGFVQALRGV